MNRCSQKTLFKEVGFSVLLELLASLTTTGSSHGSGLCDHQDPEVHRSINIALSLMLLQSLTLTHHDAQQTNASQLTSSTASNGATI